MAAKKELEGSYNILAPFADMGIHSSVDPPFI